jgi:hypothetical protein
MKDVQSTGEAFSTPKKTSSTSKLLISSLCFNSLPIFCPCGYRTHPADQNQCGSIRIRIHNTEKVNNILSAFGSGCFYPHTQNNYPDPVMCVWRFLKATRFQPQFNSLKHFAVCAFRGYLDLKRATNKGRI